MEFTKTLLRENLWSLDQGGVRCFLLIGEDKALLIDTGFGGDLRSICAEITDLPITLLTTHSDRDHTGCDAQFPQQYIHPDEMPRYRKNNPDSSRELLPIVEGDTLTVDPYTLEVLLVPGHTPGSIALLDRTHQFLIAGDTVQTHCIFMHGDGRDLSLFRESIARLESMRQNGDFVTVYAAHGEAETSADILPDILAMAKEVLAGSAEPFGPAPDRFPETVKVYKHGRAQMYHEMK